MNKIHTYSLKVDRKKNSRIVSFDYFLSIFKKKIEETIFAEENLNLVSNGLIRRFGKK
jgi:hypothetical protein